MKNKLLLLFIAFSASFITMVALSLFSIERYNTYTEYSDDVLLSNRIIRMLYKTEVFLKDVDRWERGYILTNDTAYLNVMDNVIDSLPPSLNELEKLIADNPRQKDNLKSLKDNIIQRIKLCEDDIDYIDSTHSKLASTYYFKGRKYMMASTKIMRDMQTAENMLLAVRYNNQQFYERLTTSTLKSLLFIFCIVTLFLFLLLMKLMRSGAIYQEDLRAKVADLKRSHSELQDIAYAISHDLQEPLRKIQVFSNLLIIKRAGIKDDETGTTLNRINTSAKKMQVLISDLVSLTNLTKTDENKSPIDLNRLAEYIVIDRQSKIQEKGASVRIENLPEIDGYETQIKILFSALLDNALKFTKPDTKPLIAILHTITNGVPLEDLNPNLKNQEFHCISITDNGIGFDNKYITNIFRIFRRLHTEQSEYEGKGIGLAICQRIMTNHDGYIIGDGTLGTGATFRLYFPVK